MNVERYQAAHRFMLTEIDRLTAIRVVRPEESLFAEKEWLISPEPFAIEARLLKLATSTERS